MEDVYQEKRKKGLNKDAGKLYLEMDDQIAYVFANARLL